VDLNPPGAIFSSARTTDGTCQAGQAYAGEGTYYTYLAYCWAGSVDTRVDLHALLPSEYTMSEAAGVYTDECGIWVVGYAHRTGVQCNQAILWHLPASTPGDLDGDRDVDLDDLATLLSNYGTTGGMTYEDGDLDGDGDVDLSDLAELLSRYGTSCE
jgi:hypothetical protein